MGFLAALGFIVVLGAIFFYDALVWGLVAYKFWGWFALPIFPMLPELSFGYAVGLMCLAGLFKYHNTESLKKEYKDQTTQWVAILVMPWAFLFFGWLTMLIFMG